MIRSLLSADLPRSRLVTLLLVLVVGVLALAPFLLPGTKALRRNCGSRTCSTLAGF